MSWLPGKKYTCTPASIKAMIALVRRAQLKWFGLYCAIVGILVLLFLA